MPEFESRAVRALVLLLDVHFRRCVATWHDAKAADVTLPPSAEPHYHSLDALLAHILEAAREELVWICGQLELTEPEVSRQSSVDQILAAWKSALVTVSDEAPYEPEFTSGWGLTYSISSMLEHVVMHAIRHEFQLAELLSQKA